MKSVESPMDDASIVPAFKVESLSGKCIISGQCEEFSESKQASHKTEICSSEAHSTRICHIASRETHSLGRRRTTYVDMSDVNQELNTARVP